MQSKLAGSFSLRTLKNIFKDEVVSFCKKKLIVN